MCDSNNFNGQNANSENGSSIGAWCKYDRLS